MVAVQVLLEEVVHHLDGFGRREERDAGSVAEEAQVPVVGHDVDRRVPRDTRRGGGSWAHVVDGGDVDACEAQAGEVVEHVGVCGRCRWEWEGGGEW